MIIFQETRFIQILEFQFFLKKLKFHFSSFLAQNITKSLNGQETTRMFLY